LRALQNLAFSTTVGTFLFFCAIPIPAQTFPAQPAQNQTNVESARHFPEKPPVSFDLAESADHKPIFILTNLYQYPLTAYIVQADYIVRTGPKLAGDPVQTQVCDALTHIGGLLASVPRGLSHKIGLLHLTDESARDAKLVAAVWEDGSTFGPDEMLARISELRKAQANRYDLAIATLQTGLEKNWSAKEYFDAAQKLKPPLPPKTGSIAEAKAASEQLTAEVIPGLALRDNMQHAVQDDSPPAGVAKLAQILLKQFQESRDALRKALSRPPPPLTSP